MANYELGALKRAAARGVKPKDLDEHESVIYHTLRYCYRTYEKTPTESVKNRLKEFSDEMIGIQLKLKEHERNGWSDS